MKKVLLSLFVLPILAFGASELLSFNLYTAWEKNNAGNIQEGIDFLTSLLEGPSLDKLDKVHFLNAKAMMLLGLGKHEEYMKEWENLRNLCLGDGECDYEMWKCYEYSFFFSKGYDQIDC